MHDILNRFVVGEPIKSRFKPIFMWVTNRRFPAILLTCQAPDAYREKGMISIQLERLIYPNMDEQAVFNVMRSMLHDMLIHEADESILVDGSRVFDPHK